MHQREEADHRVLFSALVVISVRCDELGLGGISQWTRCLLSLSRNIGVGRSLDSIGSRKNCGGHFRVLSGCEEALQQ
jgi:hypothetical protein